MKLLMAFVLVIVFSFKSPFDGISQEIPKYNFEELLSHSDISEISLDNVLIVKKYPSRILGGEWVLKEEKFLIVPESVIFFNDKLAIKDQVNSRIWLWDINTNNFKSFGNRGRGPEEFQHIGDITVNSNYLFIQDLSNQKLHVLDSDFKLVEEASIRTSLGRIAASDKYLIAPDLFGEYILNVFQANPPFKDLSPFIEAVIPRGMNPNGYNFTQVSSNNRGDFAVAISALPYVFVFDDELRQTHVIKLTGTKIEDIIRNNPEPIPSRTSSQPMVRNIFNTIEISDTGDIYLGIQNNLYKLSLAESEYVLEKNFQFYLEKKKAAPDKTMGIFNLTKNDQEICLSSVHHEKVYCYDM